MHAATSHCEALWVLKGMQSRSVDQGLAKVALLLRGSNTDLVKQLLADGADPFARDEQGLTAVHHVKPHVSGYKNTPGPGEAILKLLLKSGGDINAQDLEGWTPLYHVAYGDSIWMASSKACFWLAYGANAAAECAQGATPLHIACQTGNADVVETLMEHGAPLSFDASSACKEDMLEYSEALDNLHLGIVLQLLQAGADVQAATAQGWLPLQCALAAQEGPASVAAVPQGGEHQAHVHSTFQAYMRDLEFRISDEAVGEGINYGNYHCYSYLPLHIGDFELRFYQELGVSDFFDTCRFNKLGRSADLFADDPIEVALMTALLHHGADVKQADTMGHLPSVPFDVAQIQKAVSALNHALEEQLSLAQSRISKAQEPEDTSYQNQRTVPKSLRVGWPSKALQFMQSMDDLQAQVLKEEEQHKHAMQASEAEFMQRMLQHQERLRSMEI